MGGNGCSCAGGPAVIEAASLPEQFSTGRTVVIWDLKSLVQGTTDYSEAVPVPPNNAIAVEVNVLNFTVGATCTGKVQTCMDPAKQNWTDAGSLTINALGPNLTIITGISGLFIRVVMSPQSGTVIVYVCAHLPSR